MVAQIRTYVQTKVHKSQNCNCEIKYEVFVINQNYTTQNAVCGSHVIKD